MSSPYTTLLEEALEAWEGVRAQVIAEFANIPAEQLGFRPRSDARSVAELVEHILESGLMMAGELSRDDADFRRQPYEDFIEEYAGWLPRGTAPGELRHLLRTTLDDGVARLRAAGELHMLQHVRRFDGLRGTRLAWMHHGIAHEYYHCGQLAVYARSMGLVPALTKRIRGSGG